MKKLLFLFTFIAVLAYSQMGTLVNAQVPSKMSYQCVIRNSTNQLVTNHQVGMRISVLQGSASGSVVYTETLTPATNANGLVSVEFGGESLASVNWSSGVYFIKTETDINGGTNYTITSTTQLLSVPYAMYAKESGSSIPGPQGEQGIQGEPGPTGPQGIQGVAGATGAQGIQGIQGATGQQGEVGATGPQGIQGEVGATGPQGIQGEVGATGPQGIQGEVGATGPQGIQGEVGATGTQGIQGEVGATGTQGIQGEVGATGTQGIQGEVGATGTQGIQGEVGATGTQGIQGEVGETGPQGIQGVVGVAIAVEPLKLEAQTLSIELATVATTGNYNDLENKPKGNNDGDILYWKNNEWVNLPAGQEGQILTMSSNNTIVWSTFTPPISYTITFNTNGGSLIAPMKVNENAMINAPANPTKIAFDFDKWYSDETLTQIVTFPYTVTTNVTFFAKWIATDPGTEGLIFGPNEIDGGQMLLNLGTASGVENIVIPAYYEGEPVTAIDGYVFFYNKNTKSVVIPETMIRLGEQAFYYATNIFALTIPASVSVMEYGVFERWESSQNLCIKGKTDEPSQWADDDWLGGSEPTIYWNCSGWGTTQYTVTFNANGGNGAMTQQTFIEDFPQNLVANTFTYAGRSFVGWNTLASGLGTPYTDGQTITLTTDLTLFAIWQLESNLTITFKANGGAEADYTQSMVYNDPTNLIANAFTKEGYTFKEWNTQPITVGNSYLDQQNITITTDLTLFARWIKEIVPCPGLPNITDIDGNVYNTVKIGNQCWLRENLKTTKYQNGVVIPNFDDQNDWDVDNTGAMCYYNNNAAAYAADYGALYNWYATKTSNGLCPTGWHVPSYSEWYSLEFFLIENGYNWDDDPWMNRIAKSLSSVSPGDRGLWSEYTGTEYPGCPGGINDVGESKRNSTGFSAVPAGYRITTGYGGLGNNAYFWSSSIVEYDIERSFVRYMGIIYENFVPGMNLKNCGFSIRCVKDSSEPPYTVYVIFKSQDGTSTLGSSIVYYGETAVYYGAAPTKPSDAQFEYAFVGWSNATNSEIADADLTNITADVTFYAAFNKTPIGGGTFTCGTSTITDIESNTYNTILIGGQCWMKENLKVKKYDTQSEKTGTLTTSMMPTTAAYYSDFSQATGDYTGNLTAEHRSKLGILYNWAAAVGVDDGMTVFSDFPGQRQGICPNGWHIPTGAEWMTLVDNLGGIPNAGKKLKTSDGWLTGYAVGDNSSGFSALPGGFANGGLSVTFLGAKGLFWTSSLFFGPYAINYVLSCMDDSAVNDNDDKSSGLSIRCVKN